MKHDPLFEQAFEVMQRIEEAGGEAYIAGGAVRDHVSGRAVGDIDIASSLPPSKIQEIFEKVIPVGIEHGTVIVRHRSTSYEVTTFRTESGYEDYRHPDEVTFVSDIRTDLARRDFTMNAMAMDRHGRIIDPFDGRKAIKHKQIRAVGNPYDRFQEDPLRMMRAVRFSSQLCFEVTGTTKEALVKQASLLANISMERVAEETRKTFAGQGIKNALGLLDETGLFHQLPFLEGMGLQKNPPLSPLKSWPEIAVFLCLQDSSFSVSAFLKTWKRSNQEKRETDQLKEAMNLYTDADDVTSWLAYCLPESLYSSFDRVTEAAGMDRGIKERLLDRKHHLPICDRKDLEFESVDLIALHPDKRKGPWISETMKAVERRVVEGVLENDYEKIKEWVITWNPPGNI
ncbi:CCA tRNA nucleotidyltransferase [Halobacillus kuroshimensis]|uniref:CCA-adding enzyme n=2 Tax=Halobacillus kuroshimensis TaxID=302481 RepID=A0ABS3DTI2_9BACI|nr:CCA tRNA nucleotidyltransferase [Halobacillus kuroshimensis]